MEKNSNEKGRCRECPVIFGPVPSRRLGVSLGVDVVPRKVCSYDCAYCELGPTTYKTSERKEYIPEGEIAEAMEEYFRDAKTGLDFVTFSGSGEPTLHASLGRLIEKAKSLTDTPVAVLTNGSLLSDPRVREELSAAEVVLPSLDAAREEAFLRINRPAKGIDLGGVIQGIHDFVADFEGECRLEVLIAPDLNDSPEDIEALARAISWIEPDLVQLGTLARPPGPGLTAIRSLESEAMERIAARLREVATVQVVTGFEDRGWGGYEETKAERITAMLKIRPVTLEDLSASTGLHATEVIKYLNALSDQYRISEVEFMGKTYYSISV